MDQCIDRHEADCAKSMSALQQGPIAIGSIIVSAFPL